MDKQGKISYNVNKEAKLGQSLFGLILYGDFKFMKKFILSFIMCTVFLGFCAPSHAALFLTDAQKEAKAARKAAIKAEKLAVKAEKKRIRNLKRFYRPVSSKMKFVDTMELMKKSPAIGAYEIILGDNYTGKPIKVRFENLSEIRKKYSSFDAINRKKLGRLYIYVDKRHKNAPPEAIAALISGMTAHINDRRDSVNEETYAWSVEAVVWGYLSRKNPDVLKQRSRLVAREEILKQQYEKAPVSARYIAETVRKKRRDIRYKWESPGYNHKEYVAKLDRLYDVYSKNVIVLDKKKKDVFPVSNTTKNGLISVPKTEGKDMQTVDESIQKEITGETKQEPKKDEAAEAREKYLYYVSSPVSASSCKAPCSALGVASCPGACPSACPNNRDIAKETRKKDAEGKCKLSECQYCKAVTEQAEETFDYEDE